jgi:hypothetical protein
MNSFTVTAVWLHLDVLLLQTKSGFFCVYKLGIVVLSQDERDGFVTMLLHGRQVTRMYKDTPLSPCWYSCVYLKFDKCTYKQHCYGYFGFYYYYYYYYYCV